MSWKYIWRLAKRARFSPKRFVYLARVDALKSLSYEFASHDFFAEARMVDAFIKSEPTP